MESGIITILAQADLTAVPSDQFKWIVVVLIGLVLVGLQVWTAFRQSKSTITNQPLTVEVVKTLHEQFADKRSFEDHVKGNTARHAQIFNEIDRVEREARTALEKRFEALGKDRQASLETLNHQFSFIRESIVAIQTELKIRNQRKP
jgi:hypothetical protein